jgi:chromosome segregation protein
MLLKRLEIHGFKSFYDRTEIEFRPGITAVVGPNGSGKSNVSDALLWVLGEQNARNLRGEGAADLIFAGTDKRRPLGMAEVSLCVDNADRALPVEFGEVTITRRVYRSGEGEFFINRTPCRLKDIYELFLDTGVGRDAYSIIGQNQIHAVLSARGEERRELLEEAAGIKKYRHRRREAQRKLEATRGNLTRVADILDELEGQVEPLEIQARVAEQWSGLNARLRELEVGLLAVDLLRKQEELQRLQDERARLHEQAEALTARLTREEAEEHAVRLDLTRLEGAIESVRRSRDEAREESLKLEGRLAVSRQQAVADASERLRLVAEQTRWESRLEELEKEAAELGNERESLETGFNELSRQASAYTPAIEAASKRMREATLSLDQTRRRSADAVARKAALEEKERQMETRLTEGEERIEAEQRRLETLTSDAETARGREDADRREAEAARERLTDLQSDLKALEDRLAAARDIHRQAQESLRERQSQAMRLSARLRSLEEMHRSLEGAYRGVKATIQAARAGLLSGEFRVIADLLTIPPQYGTALEVALGAHAQDIVVATDLEAQEAIRYLKKKNAGRATFLPLDLVRGDRMRSEPAPGIHGVAVDLVEFPNDVRPALEMLLGRILVVEDMETAVSLLRRASKTDRRGAVASGRMVTLDGELLNPNGSLTGGSREGGPGLLSRKLEMDRLKREEAEESQQLQKEEEAVHACFTALTDLERQREQLRGEIASARVEVAQRESARDHAERESRRLQQELNEANQRLESVKRRAAEAQESQSERTNALEEIVREIERLAQAESEAHTLLEEATQTWESSRAAASEVQLELARVREQRHHLEDRLRRLDRAQKEARQGIESAGESLVMLEERKAHSSSEEAALVAALETRQAAAAQFDAQLTERASERTGAMEALALKTSALRALSEERAMLTEQSHRLEVREAGLTSDVEHLQLRLLEDYEAEPDLAPMLAAAVASRQNTAIEVNRLKREMASLGTVNLGAIEEYRRVFERVTFLQTQKTDLEDAEATLLRVITEIDATTQEAFQATFARVADAFDGMFRRLFNGGRTQLVLTDPLNVLETGIDIIVQPPGKKLQHLQLLSGGEKALTAVALLFALLEVKPSPFCLLDEVDAALDDANVDRFADVVKDFAERSQFIIITHNKATMAAADTLCGVTMEEPGVSKILSVKLED